MADKSKDKPKGTVKMGGTGKIQRVPTPPKKKKVPDSKGRYA